VIKLKVDGVKDSELHYRRGYFAVSDTVVDPNQQHHSFVAAMQRNAPESSDVLFKAKLSDAGAKDKIQIDYAIDAQDITFKDEQNCGKKLNMVVGAVAWTLDKKEPTRIFQIFDPVLTPEAFASYESNGIKVRQQMILGPGPAIVGPGYRQDRHSGYPIQDFQCRSTIVSGRLSERVHPPPARDLPERS
jgi:hypothetical protein